MKERHSKHYATERAAGRAARIRHTHGVGIVPPPGTATAPAARHRATSRYIALSRTDTVDPNTSGLQAGPADITELLETLHNAQHDLQNE